MVPVVERVVFCFDVKVKGVKVLVDTCDNLDHCTSFRFAKVLFNIFRIDIEVNFGRLDVIDVGHIQKNVKDTLLRLQF